MCPLLHELYLGWLGMCFCHMGLACASYFDRKEGLLRFRGLPVGVVTSQLAQPRLFIWNQRRQNVAVNEREFHIEMFWWCGGEKAEPAPRRWNTDSVVPAADSAIVLGLGLKISKFVVLSVHVVDLGWFGARFVREGWCYRGGGRPGVHKVDQD